MTAAHITYHPASHTTKQENAVSSIHFSKYLNPFLRPLVLVILFFTATISANAQEIDFGSFGNYTIELNNITLGDLEFEGPIIAGSGIHEVELIDAYVLEIVGVKYLDAGVLIQAEGELYLDGDPSYSNDPERSIPFTLKSAYANKGSNNVSDAIPIAVSSNMADARFPILARQNQPPGPPPPPPTNNFDQSQVNETAYLYLYGEIDVGNVLAGSYSGIITITVQYDNAPDPN